MKNQCDEGMEYERKNFAFRALICWGLLLITGGSGDYARTTGNGCLGVERKPDLKARSTRCQVTITDTRPDHA